MCVLLYFFFWSLCYLFLFDIRILITLWYLLVIVLSVPLRYTDSVYPFDICKLDLKLCLYISGKLKMIISRLCLLFLICKGVVSFVKLPCLTNDSEDFQYAQKALTNLESYLETTFKNINQKIKTLNNDLELLQDDFKSL